MNIFSIERAFKKVKERGYRNVYIAIDLHDTIFKGNYTKNNENKQLYPYAREVLQWMSKRPDVKIILWSSSHTEPVYEVRKWLAEEHLVKVDFFNSNPHFPTNDLNDFSRKFAFDILFEDKAGFEGETDWLLVKNELIRIGEWNKNG